jgi:SAM-dependent methyltransferase
MRDYVYENGRRYHAYRAGGYVLPNDEDEQDRLDMLHHIYRLILDGDLFRAPLSASISSKRVLDLGCGTGLWCIEVADELPGAAVVGCDLSPIQPTWVPPNCRFYVDDIESDWTYNTEEHFDLIHGRALCGSIADWPRLFSQAYDNLRPGGYIEMQEYHCHVFSDDDTLSQVPFLADWVEQTNEAAEKHGKPLRIANKLKQFMQEAGFEDVREEVHKVANTICRHLQAIADRPHRYLLVPGRKARRTNS